MQLPAGVAPDSAAAPVMATLLPSTGEQLPGVAPPAMPQDWRYAEGREIARGGMGRVVEATDTVLGRTVALKEALSHDPEALRRFQRETRITARLEHPSIVPVHDAGFSPTGAPFYEMRKIGGRPLEALVGARGRLEERLALVPHIGAALYHLLARKPPHHNKDPDQMMRIAVNGPPQPLHEIVPGVPAELETIIDKALAHDPAKRYQNAGELAEELQRFLTGRLVAAHHYTAKEKLLRFVRRNRALVTVSAGAALAMIVGGAIAIKRVVDERDRADDQAHVAREQQRIAEAEKQKVIE